MDFFLLRLFSIRSPGFVRVTQSINSFNCHRSVFFFSPKVFWEFFFSIGCDVRCLFPILSFWSNGIQMFNVQPSMGIALSLSFCSLRNKISFFNFGMDGVALKVAQFSSYASFHFPCREHTIVLQSVASNATAALFFNKRPSYNFNIIQSITLTILLTIWKSAIVK